LRSYPITATLFHTSCYKKLFWFALI
jgi:hypothetical protein